MTTRSLLFRNTGGGSFESDATLTFAAAPTSLTVGRIDADSDLDLIVTFGDTDSARVLLNNGAGVFTATQTCDDR